MKNMKTACNLGQLMVMLMMNRVPTLGSEPGRSKAKDCNADGRQNHSAVYMAAV